MDIQEAIDMESGVTVGDSIFDTEPNESDMMLTAIFAMEELKQYLQIGTVDECRAAMERYTAKEPKFHISEFQCPNCGMENLEEIDDLGHIYLKHKYCPDCGQKLKWGD